MMASVRRRTDVKVEHGTGDIFEQCAIPRCKHIRLVLICLMFFSLFVAVIMYLFSFSSSRNVDFEKVVPDGALYVCLIPAVVFITPFLLVHFLPEDDSYPWSDEITMRNILKNRRRLRNSNKRDNLTNKQEIEPFNDAHSLHIFHIGLTAVHSLLHVMFGLLLWQLHPLIALMICICWNATYILLLVIIVIVQVNELRALRRTVTGFADCKLGHSSKRTFGEMLVRFSWLFVYFKTGSVILKVVIQLTSSKNK